MEFCKPLNKNFYSIIIVILLAIIIPVFVSDVLAFDAKKITPLIKKQTPKIASGLAPLIEKQTAKRLIFPQIAGLFTSNRATVVLEFSQGAVISHSKLAHYGAQVKRVYKNFAKVNIPITSLERLAKDIPEIKLIKPLQAPIQLSNISEGVNLTNASLFHSLGYKGKGVKIAVIDSGFDNLSQAKTQGELPVSVTAIDFSGSGLSGGGVHGTGVAEIIYDMAPEAQLYLLKIGDSVDFAAAKDYCKAQGIRVVNHSMGWVSDDAPGNGTGFICDVVNDAKNNGIVWANSAGNEALRHWQGMFTTTLASGTEIVDGITYRVHEFVTGDEESQTASITAKAGKTIEVYMRWNDWPKTNKSYGLFLFDEDVVHDVDQTAQVVASAAYMQNGTSPPVVGIKYTPSSDKTYYLAVISVDVPSNVEMEIYSPNYDLEYKVARSSIVEPSDAEGVICSGAINKDYWAVGPQESFSSQGPTNAWAGSSEKIKPDISGIDGVSNYIYGSFYGTSASAPHVAAAAALLFSIQPDMTVDQIKSELETKAVDLGSQGKDNIYGAGKLNMPDPKTYLSNVVINEFVPNPNGSNSEWVELYNKGTQAVNIGGCWIDDVVIGGSAAQKIPDGTIIQPNGYYVYKVDAGDGYLNNSGDDINFIAADKTTIMDTKLFGDSSGYPDQSIYRMPDGGNWASVFDVDPTPGLANDGSVAPKVSIRFTVKDHANTLTPDALIILYDSLNNKLSEVTTLADGTYLFDNNLSAGTYNYEVYYPSSSPDIRRLWATGQATVSSSQVKEQSVIQAAPYITAVTIKDKDNNPVTSIAVGEPLTIDVSLKNDDTLTHSAYPEIFIDDQKTAPFIFNDSKSSSPQDIPQNQTTTYTFTYTPGSSIVDNTTLYLNVAAQSKYSLNYVRTDYSNWSKSFTVQGLSNKPPVISLIPDQVLGEDTSKAINLDDYVSDPDNSDAEITWTVTGGQNISVIINALDRSATFKPSLDYYGTEDIMFTAKDPGGLTDSKTVKVIVNPVNDPPVLSDIPNQTIKKNESFKPINLDTYVFDMDNADSEIIWNITGNVDLNVLINNATRIVDITPKDSQWIGQETLTFTATDLAGASASKTVVFKILSVVNIAPELSGSYVSPTSGDTATEFTFGVKYKDSNEDPPSVMSVFIDGLAHKMILNSGQAYDGTYTFKAFLNESQNHKYYFVFSDGEFQTRLPEQGEFDGPVVDLSKDSVMLFAPSALPRILDIDKTCEFSIYYFDKSGSAPFIKNVVVDGIAHTLNLSSGTPANGLYNYSASLTESDSHKYYFEFIDSTQTKNLRLPSIGSYNEPIVTPSAGATELLVDDFEDTESNLNKLGFDTNDDGTCAISQDVSGAHKLQWNSVNAYWHTCFNKKPDYLQAKKYNVLSFKIMSEQQGSDISLVLESAHGLRKEVKLKDYCVVTNQSQPVDIPLYDFIYDGLDISDLFSLAFVFKDNSGTIYIDDIKFWNNPLIVPVDVAHNPTIKPPSNDHVQIVGNKLYLNGEAFFAKSVGYQPVPVGEASGNWDNTNTAIYERDFNLINNMGANTIKTWSNVSAEFMSEAEQYGLMVIAGFYIDGSLNLADIATRNSIKGRFRNYVRAFKDRPNLLMWSIGNEQNILNGDNAAWYSLANELGQIAYDEEGSSYHPVLIDNADIDNIGFIKKAGDDESLSYIDVWGVTLYRGRSVGFVFMDIFDRTHKPVLVTEFGVDAYDNIAGREDQASQQIWEEDIWNEIAAGENCIGGSVMEYSDEWWKWEYGSAAVHDTGGWQLRDGVSFDNFTNEEYYGLVSIEDNGLNIDNVIPRESYYAMGRGFKRVSRSFINVQRPVASVNLDVTSSGTDANLSWQASQGSDIGGYNIYRSEQSGKGFTRINSLPVTGTTYVDNGLPERVYYYMVSAVTSGHVLVESFPGEEKIVYIGNNIPPVIASLPDKTLNEDTTIDNAFDLWAYVSDDRDTNEQLQFIIQSVSNANLGVTIDSNRYIDIKPSANFYGMGDVTIRVTDRLGAYSENTFSVTVNPINDAPIILQIPDLVFDEDTVKAINLDDYVSDVDNAKNEIIWSVKNNVKIAVSVDPVTHLCAFTPMANYSGTEFIIFTAKDPGGLSDSRTVKVVINPVNDPPVFEAISDKTIDEVQELIFTVKANDIDSTILTYSASNLPQGAIFDASARAFKWTPSYAQGRIEPYEVIFTVTDGTASVSIDVKITVNKAAMFDIVIVSPINNSQVSGIVNVSVYVNAAVENVNLYVDGNLTAVDSTLPYSFSWNTANMTNGAHIIKARANRKGQSVYSEPVSVIVNNSGLDVRIVSPTSGAVVKGAVNIESIAQGANFVFYYIDENWVAMKFSPYGYSWDTLKAVNGRHRIYIKAFYLSKLKWVVSQAVTLIVDNPNPPHEPWLDLSLIDGEVVSGVVTINAQLTDGLTSGVYFYVDDKFKLFDFTAPYQYQWDTASYSAGSHTIKATAYIPSARKYITRICAVIVDNTR